MRLASHSLPRDVHKHLQTVKHKKSSKKLLKLQTKRERAEARSTVEMATEGAALVPALSEEEKAAAKAERKRLNAPKNFYKKQVLSMSGKNGPRACNRGYNF